MQDYELLKWISILSLLLKWSYVKSYVPQAYPKQDELLSTPAQEKLKNKMKQKKTNSPTVWSILYLTHVKHYTISTQDILNFKDNQNKI